MNEKDIIEATFFLPIRKNGKPDALPVILTIKYQLFLEDHAAAQACTGCGNLVQQVIKIKILSTANGAGKVSAVLKTKARKQLRNITGHLAPYCNRCYEIRIRDFVGWNTVVATTHVKSLEN